MFLLEKKINKFYNFAKKIDYCVICIIFRLTLYIWNNKEQFDISLLKATHLSRQIWYMRLKLTLCTLGSRIECRKDHSSFHIARSRAQRNMENITGSGFCVWILSNYFLRDALAKKKTQSAVAFGTIDRCATWVLLYA